MSIKQGCLLLAALLALLHFSRFDLRQTPIVTDVRYYVHFAPLVADGAVPHRDFFDNKTQLATYAGAVLVRAGRALGVEPLPAMRGGYLALSAVAALLLFAIQRRLYGGSCVAGLLGMLCWLGFSLLGFLPAIGPLPKLLMGICASLAALSAYAGWWTTAGALGAVAFLDWQIGVLAGLGVFAAALSERGARVRTAARTAAGGGAVLLASGVWFAAHGALGVTWHQVVLTSLARGETALAHKTFAERLLQILETVRVACPGHAWLAALGVVGMALFPLLAWRLRGTRAMRLVIALAVFHYGIVAFSLADYQAYGDLFALLASLALFAGVALNELWRLLDARAARGADAAAAARRRQRLAVAAVLLAVVALRVARPRLDIALPDKIAKGATTLEQQRSVARQITAATAGLGSVVFVNCPEQLFLTGRANPLPFGFWNRATYAYFKEGAAEGPFQALARLVDTVRPDAVLCPTPRAENDLVRSGAFERVVLRADGGGYAVVLLRRRAVPLPPGNIALPDGDASAAGADDE